MTSRTARSRGLPPNSRFPGLRRGPTLALIGGGVAIVILAAAVALISSAPPTALAEPASRKLVVAGSALPAMPQNGVDPAAGQLVPSITGTGLAGEMVKIGPERGAQAVVVLAHWCPHCQAEIPMLTDWLTSHPAPAGVRIVALSTAIDPARPNYPSSAWLKREGWTQPTLIDDEGSSALAALGITSFPAFVFVKPDGTVASRMSGEVSGDQFARALESIAP